jgi:3-methyladenine DNA glycosylase AlkD
MMDIELIDEIRLALKNNADIKTRNSSSRFFKKGEEALVYGVKTAEVSKIAKRFGNLISTYSKQDVFAICEELWKYKYLEEAIIACKFTESIKDQYESADFKLFERLVNKYVNNWADCDTLCNHTIGTFIMMYPEYVNELKIWAKSPNRWVKRASAVTLIIPARKGLFLKEIFEISDILLLDKDDMVQKGYGWMLKAASQSNLMEVFDYVVSRKELMPRTALRYAIEKMPKDLKVEAMKK